MSEQELPQLTAEQIVDKRLADLERPQENVILRKAAKKNYLSTVEEVLERHGVKQEVNVVYAAEGQTFNIPSYTRTTPEATLPNGRVVTISEELLAVSPTSTKTDTYFVKAFREKQPSDETLNGGVIYSAGPPATHRKGESFVAVEKGRQATIEEIYEGMLILDTVDTILMDSIMDQGFEMAFGRPPKPQNPQTN